MDPEPLPGSVVGALRLADAAGLAVRPSPGVLSGFSGEKVAGALQRLAALYPAAESCYVEVGVYQGLSLLSVAVACPDLPCHGIDNFSQFDPHGKNRQLVEQRRARLGTGNARIIDRDFEDALVELDRHLDGRKVGVYFIDGPHDYRSQRVCLDLIVPHLRDRAVIVVDDANYAHVRLATLDFLRARPDFRLVFEAYTARHPMNMSADGSRAARAGWWNGVHVLVREPERALRDMLPASAHDRAIHIADHLIHTARVGAAAPQILEATDPLFARADLSFRDLARALRATARLIRSRPGRQRFRTANTDSEHLPAIRFHPDV